MTAVAYWIFTNLTEAVMSYWQYMLTYAVVAGLVSFAVMYRWGGVSHPRTFDLICWFLQLVGLCLIYFSTSCTWTSVALVIAAQFTYHVPMR